jgi:LPXTG-motif cell wall-anchored protein
MRKLFLMVSVAMAALLTLSGAVLSATASASADPYGPIPKPHCFIRVLHAEAGERVIIQVGARLNSTDQPSGTIAVRLHTNPRSSDEVWTTKVHTDGKPVRITGPVVPEGTHRITTRFAPDEPSEVRPCQGSQYFDVDEDGDDDGDDGDDGDGDNGGLLPDTGGPAMLWLLAGLVLVASGAGIVVYSRRRAQVPAH